MSYHPHAYAPWVGYRMMVNGSTVLLVRDFEPAQA
jgi:hypothetical protein